MLASSPFLIVNEYKHSYTIGFIGRTVINVTLQVLMPRRPSIYFGLEKIVNMFKPFTKFKEKDCSEI